jgi:precorrin-3B methylase
MAIEYEIIEDKRLVIAKGSGVVTGNDVISHLETLAADERYVAPMKKLVDYSSIDSIRQSNEEVIIIARKKEALERKFAGEKCAFVSPADLTFGIARVHQALIDSTGINTNVFRRIEEALEWLDVELDMNSE